MKRLSGLLALALAVVALPARGADDDLTRILKTVPEWMNILTVVDVKGINQTPRAKKEEWAKKHQSEYLSGAINIPPKASMVVLTGIIEPRNLSRSLTIGMVPVPQFVTMKDLAAREGGTMEEISGCTAVLSPRRGYIVQLPSHIVAGTETLPRQLLARWIRHAKSNEAVGMATYLREAVATKKDAHVFLAFNMEDMLDPISVRLEVNAAGVGSEGIEGFIKLITNVKGITFTARIDETTKGSMRIDFAGEVELFKKSLQTFLVRMLGEYGAEIEEFQTAVPRFEKNSVTFDAEISDRSLRRILSLVGSPTSLDATSDTMGSSSSPAKEAASLTATLRYYRAIDTLIEDLKVTASKKKNASDLNKSATWYDTYAAKIEQLSIIEVDPEVQKYGASVASKFHAMAGSLRGTKIQMDNYDSYSTIVAVGSSSGWGRFAQSSVSSQSNIPEIRTKQAELANKLEPEREKLWTVIEDDRQKVRREMAAKYKVDFETFK